MNDLLVEERGYTVIYETAKGGIGYIGIDDHSGGYPYFADWIENRHVFKDVESAKGLIKTGMSLKRSFGAEQVHFGTMRVVRVSTVFVDVNDDDDRNFFERTLKKLSDAEVDVIKRHLGGAK